MLFTLDFIICPKTHDHIRKCLAEIWLIITRFDTLAFLFELLTVCYLHYVCLSNNVYIELINYVSIWLSCKPDKEIHTTCKLHLTHFLPFSHYVHIAFKKCHTFQLF